MDPAFSYKTIQKIAEGIFTDKGSKFIGYVFPVETEDDFKTQLKKIKSEHVGARHFCYAYRLGKQSMTNRSNDDGEPSGTAGKPILNQLISASLTQTGLVVVRYFGGTLLGTTGLIQAYKGAAKLAIENASILEKPITEIREIVIPFSQYNDFMNLLKRLEINSILLGSTYESSTFRIEIPVQIEPSFLKEMKEILLP
jgi:uncharacterized YigZ family protein